MSECLIAVVGDIHHGRDTFTKRGTKALPLLEGFLDKAWRERVDAIVDLGDRISDVDAETDRALMADVAERFEETTLPRYHVNGNHDRAFLSEAENAALMGPGATIQSVEIGGVRLVFWRPDVALTRTRGFSLVPGDLGRLSDLLAASTKRTLLFSHVPLSGQSMAGNYWFEENPAHAAYAEQAAIRAVLAHAPCPLVAIAGHVHWNSLTQVDGVSHLTLQSLSDGWRTMPEPAGTSALLRVTPDTLQFQVDGRDPISVDIPFSTRKGRRIERLPPFADIFEDPVERYRVMAEPEADAA